MKAAAYEVILHTLASLVTGGGSLLLGLGLGWIFWKAVQRLLQAR